MEVTNGMTRISRSIAEGSSENCQISPPVATGNMINPIATRNTMLSMDIRPEDIRPDILPLKKLMPVITIPERNNSTANPNKLSCMVGVSIHDTRS